MLGEWRIQGPPFGWVLPSSMWHKARGWFGGSSQWLIPSMIFPYSPRGSCSFKSLPGFTLLHVPLTFNIMAWSTPLSLAMIPPSYSFKFLELKITDSHNILKPIAQRRPIVYAMQYGYGHLLSNGLALKVKDCLLSWCTYNHWTNYVYHKNEKWQMVKGWPRQNAGN